MHWNELDARVRGITLDGSTWHLERMARHTGAPKSSLNASIAKLLDVGYLQARNEPIPPTGLNRGRRIHYSKTPDGDAKLFAELFRST